MIAACFAFMGKPALDFFNPPYSRAMLDALSDLSEGMVLTVTENYCVLNYERVARACLPGVEIAAGSALRRRAFPRY